jgi:hypothetical protein
MPKPAAGKLFVTGKKFGKKGHGSTQTLAVRLSSMAGSIPSDIRQLFQQRQDDRISAAMRGDRSAMEYAEAQLRYLLSKVQVPLTARLGPGIRVLEIAVVTDPNGDLTLACKCWVDAQLTTTPTETML